VVTGLPSKLKALSLNPRTAGAGVGCKQGRFNSLLYDYLVMWSECGGGQALPWLKSILMSSDGPYVSA
jgi:hypothetical protein